MGPYLLVLDLPGFAPGDPAFRGTLAALAEEGARDLGVDAQEERVPLALHHALEDLVRDGEFARVVGRGHPQADDLGAHFAAHVLRRHGVAQRLGHLLALAIDHKSVRQHGFIGRAPVRRDPGQQRAVEPAAVLVGPFEIEIRRPPLSGLEHRGKAHAGLEPDVQNIPLFFKYRPSAFRACSPDWK